MRITTLFSHHSIQRLFFLSLGWIFLLFIHRADALALNIPLTIQEALPNGVIGVARISEPVTVGIPLEEKGGITSVGQLGLTGSNMGQFRELARWPNGNIKWVLVDFQTDAPASGMNTSIALVNGTGNFGGSPLAADNRSTITVNTGPAQFTIRTANFNLFETITVNGQTLLSGGTDGLLLRDASNAVYTSANDPSSTAIIEENGPVRAVIKAEGRFKSSAGLGHLWFTVRLHFYKNKSYVKAYATLRNADASIPTPQLFNSVELVVPLVLGSPKTFEFARKADTVSGALSGRETASLYQAFSTDKLGGDWSYWDQWEGPISRSGDAMNFAQKGLEINYNGTLLNSLGNQDDWTRGWGELRDSSSKGLTVAIRWMSALWPAGFEMDGSGAVRIELYSKHNSKTNLKFAWGAYDTREVLLDFHAAAVPNEAVLYRLQYPILARAPLNQYAASGAFYGETRLVTAEEHDNWFKSRAGMSPDNRKWPSLANRKISLWRYWDWNQGSGSNQMDFALADLMDYFRTGHGGFFLNGEQQTLYKSDSAIVHSDGFDYARNPIAPDNSKNINGKSFDRSHSHWISIPILYYLTGNELLRDSILDYGEDLDQQTASSVQIRVGSQWDDMRIWSRSLRNFALMFEFTRSPRYETIFTKMVNLMLDSRDNPPNIEPYGRNLGRGYMWLDHQGSLPTRQVNDFFQVQIHFEAVWESWRVLKTTVYSKTEDIEDYMLGLALFYYHELYFEENGGTSVYDYGYLYDYDLDNVNTPAGNSTVSAENPNLRPISSGRPMGYLFELTGDPKYLDRETKLLRGDIELVTTRTPSEGKSHAFLWADIHRMPQQVMRFVPSVAVKDNGAGSFTLSWTVPQGARAYKIKYANKSIVDWLGFNQATRTYQFDPASNVPFFAATNASSEPSPLPSGSLQEYTITDLDPTQKWHFSVKYLAGDGLDSLSPMPPTGLRVK